MIQLSLKTYKKLYLVTKTLKILAASTQQSDHLVRKKIQHKTLGQNKYVVTGVAQTHRYVGFISTGNKKGFQKRGVVKVLVKTNCISVPFFLNNGTTYHQHSTNFIEGKLIWETSHVYYNKHLENGKKSLQEQKQRCSIRIYSLPKLSLISQLL